MCWNPPHTWGPPGLAPNPGRESGKFSPGSNPLISCCQVLSDLVEETSDSSTDGCWIFCECFCGDWKGSVLPCWKARVWKHALFLSLRCFVLGGGWRQLPAPAAERGPSLCTSISITPSPLCVWMRVCVDEEECAWEGVCRRAPPSGDIPHNTQPG